MTGQSISTNKINKDNFLRLVNLISYVFSNFLVRKLKFYLQKMRAKISIATITFQ